jgi:hypothetical protein
VSNRRIPRRPTLPGARVLRRAGGVWTPASPTPGGYTPEHWYRSDGPLWQDAGLTRASSDGDPIGRWDDLTGNADHISQGMILQKPSLQSGLTDLLNGYPVIRFDGQNDWLRGAFTNGGAMNQPNTWILVAKLSATLIDDGNYHYLASGDDITNYHELAKNAAPGHDKWIIYAGAILAGNDADGNWNIWTAVFNGASSQFWHNGISEASGNAGAHNPDGITLGARGSADLTAACDIAEVLLYEPNLTDADKNKIGQYLADRYALSYTNI